MTREIKKECKCECHSNPDNKTLGRVNYCSKCIYTRNPMQTQTIEELIDEAHSCGFNQRVDCEWLGHNKAIKALLKKEVEEK